ncbi:MAG: hypothetical protein NT169_22980 [Chloroflexi bacterium]|nr:hypothetical protein [Chloroflexota bacterium]
MATIGTLHESPLHAALKARYAQPGAAVEVELHGYVVDVVGADCWIEIQTGHVAQIKRKLACLVEQHPVRLVLPVTVEKWLVRVGPDGATLGRRKSPQRGAVEGIFRELVSIPHLLAHPNFTLAAPLIQEEEVRRHDPAHNWRRQGWGTVERRLLAVVAERVFVTPADLAGLLPPTLAEPFTARELAAALGHPVGLAHQMIYCLRALAALTPAGQAGRALTYTRASPPD